MSRTAALQCHSLTKCITAITVVPFNINGIQTCFFAFEENVTQALKKKKKPERLHFVSVFVFL